MRRIPSLDTLRAFEAAARHLNFTKAAKELHVSQSALSQRIGALEGDLGFPLFRRAGRTLTLTPRGKAIAEAMARALVEITAAFAALDGDEAAPTLILSVLPSFAARWLMPRLPRFQAEHAHIQVQVHAEGRLIDLADSEADLAVRFGHGNYPGHVVDRLMDDYLVPVGRPELRPAGGSGWADLTALPLLHDIPAGSDQSGTDWRSWFAHVGLATVPAPAGSRFSQADLMLQAAEQGLGVALARYSLVHDDLVAGRLVPLAPPPMLRARYEYYLVSLPEKAEKPAILAFRRWLARESRAFMALRDGAMR